MRLYTPRAARQRRLRASACRRCSAAAARTTKSGSLSALEQHLLELRRLAVAPAREHARTSRACPRRRASRASDPARSRPADRRGPGERRPHRPAAVRLHAGEDEDEALLIDRRRGAEAPRCASDGQGSVIRSWTSSQALARANGAERGDRFEPHIRDASPDRRRGATSGRHGLGRAESDPARGSPRRSAPAGLRFRCEERQRAASPRSDRVARRAPAAKARV